MTSEGKLRSALIGAGSFLTLLHGPGFIGCQNIITRALQGHVTDREAGAYVVLATEHLSGAPLVRLREALLLPSEETP